MQPFPQKAKLAFKWTFNNTLENIIELPAVERTSQQYDTDSTSSATASQSYYDEPNYSVHLNDVAIRTKSAAAATTHHPVLPANVYPYRIENFQSFGTISCVAKNAIGHSGTCMYHIMAAEVPDAVRNCSASNSSASSVHVACVAGQNGGIQQFFHVEVFNEQTQMTLYNTSFAVPEFTVKRLPSNAEYRLRVLAYNRQGSASSAFQLKIRTLPAALHRTGKRYYSIYKQTA